MGEEEWLHLAQNLHNSQPLQRIILFRVYKLNSIRYSKSMHF